jgi:hypothetical protein
VQLLLRGVVGPDNGLGCDRSRKVGLLDRGGRWRDNVVGDADVQSVEDLREDDHTDAETDEDDRRIENLIPQLLDAVEQLLDERVILNRSIRHTFNGHLRPPFRQWLMGLSYRAWCLRYSMIRRTPTPVPPWTS